MQQYTICVPEGYELIQTGTKKYEIQKIGETQKKEDKLPKTWEEYCDQCPNSDDEYYIDECSNIVKAKPYRDSLKNRNLLLSQEQADAFLALMQLVRLQDYYNELEPFADKLYAIDYDRLSNYLIIRDVSEDHWNHVLSFNTIILAEQFLANFRDLIEQAKELI